MLGFQMLDLGLRARGDSGIAPAVPKVPPADWRMPASVTTSQGIVNMQPALAAASSSASARQRPTVTIPDASTQRIEWAVAEGGEAILSFIPRATTGSYTVALDGVDQGFAKAIPEGTSEVARRQAICLPVAAGQAIRLTITTSGGACDIEPLLHRKPDAGPWDALLVFGPSLLQTGYQSSAMESSILAAFPTRDPILFNYARTSYTAAQLAAISDEAVAHFGDCARYAWVGGILVNGMANDVPGATKIAADTAQLTTIFDNFEAAGLTVGMGTTRYIKYGGAGAPEDQTTGARAYDSAIVSPFIASHIPDLYDLAIQRPRVEEYLLDLYHRDLHSDYIHGSGAQYALERAMIADTFLRRVYTGSWSYVSQIEARIAMAEADSIDSAKAVASHMEAGYAVRALDPGAPRDAFQARLDAVWPRVLFFDAKRLIAVAELSRAPADKASAQDALDAANAAGFVDMASPNTNAEQQARIDAIAGVAFDQVVQVQFGNPASTGGWNVIAPGGNISAPGTAYPLVESSGAASGVSLVIEGIISPTNSATGPSTGSQIEEFPDPRLQHLVLTSNGGGLNTKFTGLDDGATYDLVAVGTGNNAANRRTALVVNGVNHGDRGENDRLTNPWRVPNLAPVAGEIDVNFVRGTGSGYTYAVGLVLKRHA